MTETVKGFRAVLRRRHEIGANDPDLLMLADHFDEEGYADEAYYLRTHIASLEWLNGMPTTHSDSVGFESGKWAGVLVLLRDPVPVDSPTRSNS